MIAIDRRTSPARRGVTLIEMMVVIGTLAILMGICAVTIQLLLRISSDTQSRRGAAAAIGRLSEQFRADAHASEAAEPRPGAGLRLRRGDGGTIDYEARGGLITRVESARGRPARRESYALGPLDTAAFERRDDGPRRLVAVVVRRRERPGAGDPVHPEEIVAAIGVGKGGGIVASKSGGGQPR